MPMSNAFQVSSLAEASESYGTLNNVLDFDVQNDTVRTPRSLSRCLRRVRLGLDLIMTLFQNFLSSKYAALLLELCFNPEFLVIKVCGTFT